jgi:hypothetical protein
MTESLRCLLEDEGRARSFGEAGRRRAEQEFTKSTMFRRTLGVYKDALEARAASPKRGHSA